MAKSLTLSELTEEGHDFSLRMIKKFGNRVENKLEEGKTEAQTLAQMCSKRESLEAWARIVAEEKIQSTNIY